MSITYLPSKPVLILKHSSGIPDPNPCKSMALKLVTGMSGMTRMAPVSQSPKFAISTTPSLFETAQPSPRAGSWLAICKLGLEQLSPILEAIFPKHFDTCRSETTHHIIMKLYV